VQDRAENRLAARVDPYVEKQRVVVMTDIANEPDDPSDSYPPVKAFRR
jgi:hypothetical protein